MLYVGRLHNGTQDPSSHVICGKATNGTQIRVAAQLSQAGRGGGHFQRTTPQPIRHESLKLGGGDLRFVERLFLTPFWYWYLGEMVSAAPTTASSAARPPRSTVEPEPCLVQHSPEVIHPHADVGWRSPYLSCEAAFLAGIAVGGKHERP